MYLRPFHYKNMKRRRISSLLSVVFVWTGATSAGPVERELNLFSCEFTNFGCCPFPDQTTAKLDVTGSNCRRSKRISLDTGTRQLFCQVTAFIAPYDPFTTTQCAIHGAECSPWRPCCSPEQLRTGSLVLHQAGMEDKQRGQCFLQVALDAPLLQCQKFRCEQIDRTTGSQMGRASDLAQFEQILQDELHIAETARLVHRKKQNLDLSRLRRKIDLIKADHNMRKAFRVGWKNGKRRQRKRKRQKRRQIYRRRTNTRR